jgi:hypothetical protein
MDNREICYDFRAITHKKTLEQEVFNEAIHEFDAGYGIGI